MPVTKVDSIWMNGALIPWDEAKIHVLSHVVHYGTSWFEGIRCYNTRRGGAVFRLERHMRRLVESARIYRTEIPFTAERLADAALETIRANRLKACYIRPVVFRGYGDVGVNPLGCPVEVAIAVWEWGAYLGEEALRDGIDVMVSSWHRPAPNTVPTMAKTGGNYVLSQLMKMEALQNGFAEAVALDTSGYLSEGSGENLFAVKDRTLYTTPWGSSILPGITRDSILLLATEAGYEVREQALPREMLYVADELFFTGTAAEVTPIRSVDRIAVGAGRPGPVTLDLQKRFFDIVHGGEDPHGWLTFVYRE
jgi:branched-chain amino acid aminotransferase